MTMSDPDRRKELMRQIVAKVNASPHGVCPSQIVPRGFTLMEVIDVCLELASQGKVDVDAFWKMRALPRPSPEPVVYFRLRVQLPGWDRPRYWNAHERNWEHDIARAKSYPTAEDASWALEALRKWRQAEIENAAKVVKVTVRRRARP